MANYLVEVDAHTGAGVETLRYAVAAVTTRPMETPANTTYLPRILDAGGVTWGMEDDGARFEGGDLLLNNADGRLDMLRTYGWGRRITIRDVRDPAAAITTAPVVFRGTVDGVDTGDGWASVRLKIRDRLSDLDRALLTETYAGTTVTNGPTAEGTADLKGQIKPRAFGIVGNMAPILVNPFDLIYQATAGRAHTITVYDGAVPLPHTGDYPTLAALHAAGIPAGGYATCLALGLFRLGASPVFVVTCDVTVGDRASRRSASSIALAMLDTMGIAVADRLAASFADLQTRAPAELGLLVADGAPGVSLIQRVLATVGAALVPDTLGRFGVVQRGVPAGSPQVRVGVRQIIGKDAIAIANGQDGTPAWKVTVNHSRIWRTMAGGDIAGSVSDPARKDRLGKDVLPAVAENPAVKDVHPRAREIVVDSLFAHAADAEARAADLLAQESVLRTQISVGVPEELARGLVPGAPIEIDLPRFGQEGGRLFQLLARRDDWQARQAVLTAWR